MAPHTECPYWASISTFLSTISNALSMNHHIMMTQLKPPPSETTAKTKRIRPRRQWSWPDPNCQYAPNSREFEPEEGTVGLLFVWTGRRRMVLRLDRPYATPPRRRPARGSVNDLLPKVPSACSIRRRLSGKIHQQQPLCLKRFDLAINGVGCSFVLCLVIIHDTSVAVFLSVASGRLPADWCFPTAKSSSPSQLN
jgi:hypothetical protein